MVRLVEFEPESGRVVVNVELVPPIIRHEMEPLAEVLAEKYKLKPRNRATRRQIERDVHKYVAWWMRRGFVHRAQDGALEVVPEELPQPVRDWVPDLIEALNRRFVTARVTEATLREMSRFVQAWVEQKLSELEAPAEVTST